MTLNLSLRTTLATLLDIAEACLAFFFIELRLNLIFSVFYSREERRQFVDKRRFEDPRGEIPG